MELTSIILCLAAIIPAAFYILYVDMFDSHKPEPRRLLFVAAFVGAVVALAVTYSGLFVFPEGLQIKETHPLMESLSIGFLKLAIPIEVLKFVALFIFLSLNKYYDEYLDGMVYSVSLAMGFAGVWDVWFITSGLDTASFEIIEKCIFIILVLIPIHLAASSMMGYFFALTRNKHKTWILVLALLLPIVISGLSFSLLFLLGNHVAYYIIIGILFTILSMIFYTQVFKLLKKDGIKTL